MTSTRLGLALIVLAAIGCGDSGNGGVDARITYDAAQTQDAAQNRDATQNQDATQNRDATQNQDATQNRDATQNQDATQLRDATTLCGSSPQTYSIDWFLGVTAVAASKTICAGDTVTWTWTDNLSHSVTATGGAFDSGLATKPHTFSFTFNSAGTFPYVCSIHASMKGTIIVQ